MPHTNVVPMVHKYPFIHVINDLFMMLCNLLALGQMLRQQRLATKPKLGVLTYAQAISQAKKVRRQCHAAHAITMQKNKLPSFIAYVIAI